MLNVKEIQALLRTNRRVLTNFRDYLEGSKEKLRDLEQSCRSETDEVDKNLLYASCQSVQNYRKFVVAENAVLSAAQIKLKKMLANAARCEHSIAGYDSYGQVIYK